MRSATRRTGILVREDADLHGRRRTSHPQVLRHDRRLIAGLQEQIGREEAVRALLDDHHRVPVMDVRRLEEAQRVATQRERLAVVKPRTRRSRRSPAR